MFELLKLLIVVNIFLVVIQQIFNIKLLKYILSFLIILIPIFEIAQSGAVLAQDHLFYLFICIVFLKTLRMAWDKSSCGEVAILNNIVILHSMMVYGLNHLFVNIAIVTVMILSIGLIKTKRKNLWPYFIFITISILSILIRYYTFDSYNEYFIFHSLFVVLLISYLLLIPVFFLQREVLKENSLFVFSFVSITCLSFKYIFPFIDSRLRFSFSNIESFKILVFVPLTLICVYWLLRIINNKNELSKRIFYLYMSQLTIGLYLGLITNNEINITVIKYCLITSLFYLFVRESINKNEIKDHALFAIGTLGLVSFPPGGSFIYKVQYLEIMYLEYNWYYIVGYLFLSVLVISSSYYLIRDLQKSYNKNGLVLWKHELTLFAIIIYILPGYII